MTSETCSAPRRGLGKSLTYFDPRETVAGDFGACNALPKGVFSQFAMAAFAGRQGRSATLDARLAARETLMA
jgi:hypothetical protein